MNYDAGFPILHVMPGRTNPHLCPTSARQLSHVLAADRTLPLRVLLEATEERTPMVAARRVRAVVKVGSRGVVAEN